MSKSQKLKKTSSLKNSFNSNLFLFLVSLFITSIITANIIAVKIVQVFSFRVPAGVIIFPISYIIGDVLTEVYGYKKARTAIWLGFFSNLLFVISVYIAGILPAAPFWTEQRAFDAILGFTPRLLLASVTGYLIGSFSNSFVLSKLKLITRGSYLWIRTIGSTLVGEGVDSLFFITIAFYSSLEWSIISSMIIAQWVFKTLYETLVTPFTYVVIKYLKEKENIDTYDYKVDFNPFKFLEKD